MQAIRTFARDDIISAYQAIADQRIDELRRTAHSDDTLWWSSIPLGETLVENDRLKAYLHDDDAVQLIGGIKRLVKTFFPRSQVQELRFVKTLAGSGPQSVRRDFESTPFEENLMDVCVIPGYNTFLYSYGWDHKVPLQSQGKLIELNKGDVALFRGDLAYKPISGAQKNICLQGFLDPAGYVRPLDYHPHVLTVVDDTHEDKDPFCFIWRCNFRGRSLNSVRKHINRFHHIRFRKNRRRRRVEPAASNGCYWFRLLCVIS